MKRIFNRRRIFSTILNLFGMAVAMTAFMAIMKQVTYDWNYDRNYPDWERIYRLELRPMDYDPDATTRFSQPIIESFKGLTPEIEALGSYRCGSSTNFSEQGKPDVRYRFEIASADADFLKVFPFEFVEGNAADFALEGSCIISRSAAEKMFPGQSAVGKLVDTSDFGGGLEIVAVYKDFPENSSIPNGVITQLDQELLENWSEWSTMCYLKITRSADKQSVVNSLADKFVEFVKWFDSTASEEGISALKESVNMVNVHDIYFQKDTDDFMQKGNLAITNTLFAVSLLILFIAIINFINFSMASVPFDIKSINTRKVLGSSRASLVGGLLADSLFVTLLAYLLALLLLHVISGTSLASYISGSLRLADNAVVLLIGLAAAVGMSVVAGIYPALYSTSFQPALVLKGSFSLSAKGRTLRNSLVGFQYVVTFVLSAFALFIFVQTRYMKKYDMGFTSEQVLVAPVGYQIGAQAESFRQRLMQNPNILDVTYAGGNLVSSGKMGWGRDYDGNRVQLDVLPVSSNFLDFFGMEIKEGRNFMPSDEQETNGTFILNETAVAKFPFLHVGSRMTGHADDEHPAEVVGIVKDFNFKPMQYSIEPFALYNFGAYPWWPLYTAYVKVAPQDISATMQYIKDAMKETNPNIDEEYLDVWFLDESIGNLYQKEEKLNRIIIVAALVSFLISLVGILGLVYFETQFRRKEIALKKVYGASVKNILEMINMRYICMALISFAVSLPLSVAVIKLWVKSFPYQSPVPLWIFIVSLAATLAVTVITVTIRSYSAAVTNPVKSIKDE